MTEFFVEGPRGLQIWVTRGDPKKGLGVHDLFAVEVQGIALDPHTDRIRMIREDNLLHVYAAAFSSVQARIHLIPNTSVLRSWPPGPSLLVVRFRRAIIYLLPYILIVHCGYDLRTRLPRCILTSCTRRRTRAGSQRWFLHSVVALAREMSAV